MLKLIALFLTLPMAAMAQQGAFNDNTSIDGFEVQAGALSFQISGTEKLLLDNTSLISKGNTYSYVSADSTGTERNSGFYLWSDRGFGMDLHYDTTNASWANAVFGRSIDTDALRFGAYASNATAQNAFNTYMTIQNTGNVGIGTTAPAAALDVSGTIRAQQICDEAGSNCKDVSGGWSSSATLDGLTDTNLTSPADNSFLRYDSATSKWVDVALETATGSTTMNVNWPDAIQCDSSGTVLTLYHVGETSSGVHYYRYPDAGSAFQIDFDSSGNYSLNNGMTSYDCVTSSKSIATLYSEGKAFNFVGSSGDAFTLNEISNVSVPSPTDGQVLTWNNSGSAWEAASTPWAVSSTDIYRSSGNVGIGTTSPLSPLTVQGTDGSNIINILGTGGNGRLYIGADGSANAYLRARNSVDLRLGVDSSDHVIIKSSGNVGIGTSTVTEKLTVNGDIGVVGYAWKVRANNNSDWYYGMSNSASKYYMDVGGAFAANSGGGFRVIGSGAVKMIVDYDGTGKVGIGTETPIYKLDVNGTLGASTITSTGASAGLQFNNRNGAGSYQWYSNSDTAYLFHGNTSTNRIAIDASGNMGIGTSSPSQRLEVSVAGTVPQLRLTNSTASKSWDFYSYSDSNLYLNNSGGTRFTITDAGYVGIGTSSPSYKFSVIDTTTHAIYAHTTAGSGVYGETTHAGHSGVRGNSSDANTFGALGSSGAYGVYGYTNSATDIAVYARSDISTGQAFLAHNVAYNYYCYIGHSGGYSIICSGPTSGVSDERLKKDIVPLPDEDGLEAIMAITPVTYRWKDEKMNKEQKEIGFTAQNVEAVLPELVGEFTEPTLPGEEEKPTRKALQYDRLAAPIVKAIQQLKAENDALRARVEALEAQ